MNYADLIRVYFERSSALQWYWTIYVVIIGGLLAFSSLRQRAACVTTALVTILYGCFAFKNLGAIHDVTMQRIAVVQAIKEFQGDPVSPNMSQQRTLLEPTLAAPAYEGIRNFHVMSDLLTIAAVWAMELRRKRIQKEEEVAIKSVNSIPPA